MDGVAILNTITSNESMPKNTRVIKRRMTNGKDNTVKRQ